MLSSLGGFWTAINSLTFLFLSLFLYENMLKQQAKIIWRQFKNEDIAANSINLDRDDYNKSEELQTIQKLKYRLSFVSIYALYEDRDDLRRRIISVEQDMEEQINKLNQEKDEAEAELESLKERQSNELKVIEI